MTPIPQLERVLYTAKAHTSGGRHGGSSRTDDGRLDVKLAVPGSQSIGTNPEQLFAAGWSACYLSAIKLVAARSKIRLPPDVAIDAEVDLGLAAGGHVLQARLNVQLPGVAPEVAKKLMEGAHSECPYSKATRGNIHVVTSWSDTGAAAQAP